MKPTSGGLIIQLKHIRHWSLMMMMILQRYKPCRSMGTYVLFGGNERHDVGRHTAGSIYTRTHILHAVQLEEQITAWR